MSRSLKPTSSPAAPVCQFTEVIMLATRPLHHLGVMANFQLSMACCFLVGIMAISALWQVGPRSDVSSTSSSRWPYLRAERATDNTCFNRPAPAAQSLYVGLQRPCRGQACADMLRGGGAGRPASATQDLGVGIRRQCRGQTCASMQGGNGADCLCAPSRQRPFEGF